jgi:hypothetical protein
MCDEGQVRYCATFQSLFTALHYAASVIAPVDYEGGATRTLFYLPDMNTERTSCTNIAVVSDSVVESNETFLVFLTTTDESVGVLTPNTTATILDDTSK